MNSPMNLLRRVMAPVTPRLLAPTLSDREAEAMTAMHKMAECKG